ncbi:MAG: MFS transporter [Desulfobacteraceae bacterium]|nr:MFS transporter [Desulfobacteraceae bacterium]
MNDDNAAGPQAATRNRQSPPPSSRKAVWGWALYDWANSAFATCVMAGFFPLFFKSFWSAGVDVNVSTARLAIGNATAGVLVAVCAPVLGAIADRGGIRKRMLVAFAYFGATMTAALYAVDRGQWILAIGFYVAASVGFAGANIFYDALLPSVADEKAIDRVSGFGYAMGYLGGGLLFLGSVLMTLYPRQFGLAGAGDAVRLSLLAVAAWWGGFTLFTLAWVPESRGVGRSRGFSEALRGAMRQTLATVGKIRRLKTLALFLVAYWLYIDGVDTVIRMAVDYGLSLGLDANHLIVALLIVQFVGFPAALAFGILGQRWGVKRSLFLGIAVYTAVSLWATQMSNSAEFTILAVMIGLTQGGIQALSRSYYARFIPENMSGEFYGFYNMLGKFAAILGPLLMGVVALAARMLLMPPGATPEAAASVGQLASRISIGAVTILFVLGAACLCLVDEDRGRREAVAFAKQGEDRNSSQN